MNEVLQDLVVCIKCGSTDITCLARIDANTKRFERWWGDSDECFCNDCKDLTTLITLAKWLKGGGQLPKQIELMASGYEWGCPVCYKLNKEPAIREKIQCQNCELTFEVTDQHHAYK